MAFDMTGAKIATASNKVICFRNIHTVVLHQTFSFLKGTIIRIHSSIDGSCLFEFRRGVRRYA